LEIAIEKDPLTKLLEGKSPRVNSDMFCGGRLQQGWRGKEKCRARLVLVIG